MEDNCIFCSFVCSVRGPLNCDVFENCAFKLSSFGELKELTAGMMVVWEIQLFFQSCL